MAESKIQWTDATWNPVTGCDRVSPGCANCYALTLAKRLKAMGAPGYQRDGNPKTSGPGFGVTLHPDKLNEPIRWRKPRMVFVNSMSDLFHDEVPDGFILRVFAVMAGSPWHTFQVLTKRPERAAAFLAQFERSQLFDAMVSEVAGVSSGRDWWDGLEWPLPNVWLGVSIENARYTWRADVLRQIPAAVRFISAEPLLGSLFDGRDMPKGKTSIGAGTWWRSHERHLPNLRQPLDLSGIDWVIIGGESGPGARPFRLEWAREIVAAARQQVCCGNWRAECCGHYLPDGDCCGEGEQACCYEPDIVGPAVFVKPLPLERNR